MEKFSRRFPRHGKLFSTLWKIVCDGGFGGG
jgi:hypothetical protein